MWNWLLTRSGPLVVVFGLTAAGAWLTCGSGALKLCVAVATASVVMVWVDDYLGWVKNKKG